MTGSNLPPGTTHADIDRHFGEPEDGYCYDPMHDDECDCGADPDLEYERYVEDRR